MGGTHRSCCGDMTQFMADASFVAIHGAPKVNTAQLHGKMVSFKVNGVGDTGAYWVAPSKGSKVGIVMIHEYWGLNDNIKATADKLHAATGYAVLAVDLYEGKVTTDAKTAGQLMGENNADKSKLRVHQAVRDLRNGTFGGFKASKVGSVGYCFGGGWSYWTGVEGGNQVQAVAIYYGMPDSNPQIVSELKAPVMFVHAMKDKWINDKVVDELSMEMVKQHKKIEVLHYDADHAFANPSNAHYNPEFTADAWKHLLAFYKKNLG